MSTYGLPHSSQHTLRLATSPSRSASLPTFFQVCLERRTGILPPVLGIWLLQPRTHHISSPQRMVRSRCNSLRVLPAMPSRRAEIRIDVNPCSMTDAWASRRHAPPQGEKKKKEKKKTRSDKMDNRGMAPLTTIDQRGQHFFCYHNTNYYPPAWSSWNLVVQMRVITPRPNNDLLGAWEGLFWRPGRRVACITRQTFPSGFAHIISEPGMTKKHSARPGFSTRSATVAQCLSRSLTPFCDRPTRASILLQFLVCMWT